MHKWKIGRLGVERSKRENLCVEQRLENHAGRRLWVRVSPYSLLCRSKNKTATSRAHFSSFWLTACCPLCGDRVPNHLRVISPVWYSCWRRCRCLGVSVEGGPESSGGVAPAGSWGLSRMWGFSCCVVGSVPCVVAQHLGPKEKGVVPWPGDPLLL